MNDVEIDESLESRVRATLAEVAARTSVDGLVVDDPAATRGRGAARLRWMLVAAAFAALVGIATFGTGGSPPPIRTAVGDASNPFPDTYQLATALPVFVGEGDEQAVAAEYLADRFDRPPVITALTVLGDRSTADAAWAFGEGAEGVIAQGHIYLRRVAGRWAVIAATTDGVDLSTFTFDGTQVSGTVTSSNDNSLFADVLDAEGRPVPGSPRPNGHPGALRRVGTAAGPSNGSLRIDVPARQPILLQVRLVGGTFLSLSELRLDPPALPPHQDYDACVAGQHEEKTSGPFIEANRCALALQGRELAAGDVGGWPWQVVASDEPSGHWVTLRAPDLEGTFRIKDDTGDGTALANQLGACCRLHGRAIVAGSFGREVATIELADLGGAEVTAVSTFDDPDTGYRYAIAGVSTEGADPVRAVTLITMDHVRHSLDVLHLGSLGG